MWLSTSPGQVFAGRASRRRSALAIVIGLHVGIFLLILTAKFVVPHVVEMPLIVDLLPAAEMPKPPEAKPLPVAKALPTKPHAPAPKPPRPLLEASTSVVVAASAPVASTPEIKPPASSFPPAAPAAEPVSQARFDADYLRNPAPPYPASARRMGEEGKVILRVLVSPQGNAESVDIKTSSGSQRLDDAAVNTVKHWKFIPAKRGDSPVQSAVLVPIVFKLEQ